MPQHRHFLLCVAVALAALLSGCGVMPQTVGTPLPRNCMKNMLGGGIGLDTVAQLKQKARVIVVATVFSVQGGQGTPCDIHTAATVHVDRTVYDPEHQVRGTTLVVRTKGGFLPSGWGVSVQNEALVFAGNQLVLFLVPDTATTYGVVDGGQGAANIVHGMVEPMSSSSLMPLDAYITQIEQA